MKVFLDKSYRFDIDAFVRILLISIVSFTLSYFYGAIRYSKYEPIFFHLF